MLVQGSWMLSAQDQNKTAWLNTSDSSVSHIAQELASAAAEETSLMNSALHIYHLDNDEEADKIVRLLESTGIGNRWTIERPTDETNAIFVHAGKSGQDDDSRDEQLFHEAQELVRTIDRKTVEAIKAMDLCLALRITTSDFYLALPEDLVAECGIVGLQICVFNTRAFEAGS